MNTWECAHCGYDQAEAKGAPMPAECPVCRAGEGHPGKIREKAPVPAPGRRSRSAAPKPPVQAPEPAPASPGANGDPRRRPVEPSPISQAELEASPRYKAASPVERVLLATIMGLERKARILSDERDRLEMAIEAAREWLEAGRAGDALAVLQSPDKAWSPKP